MVHQPTVSVVLIAQQELMNISMMINIVNIVVHQPTVSVVLVAQQKHTDMGMVIINVFGVVHLVLALGARSAPLECMKNKGRLVLLRNQGSILSIRNSVFG